MGDSSENALNLLDVGVKGFCSSTGDGSADLQLSVNTESDEDNDNDKDWMLAFRDSREKLFLRDSTIGCLFEESGNEPL